MRKERLAFALLALGLMMVVNLVPERRAEGLPAVELELYPKSPHNLFYPGFDLTITIRMRNLLDATQTVKLELVKAPGRVVGRDGIELPSFFDIPGFENVYHSLALTLPPELKRGRLELLIRDLENRVIDQAKLDLRQIKPRLTERELRSSFGLPKDSLIICVPKYRRYWHPELDEVDQAEPGYVWLLVGPGRRLVVDDGSKEVLMENPFLPWEVQAERTGRAWMWSRAGPQALEVPGVEVIGDNGFDLERFELYFSSASRSWVTRQIFYWIDGGFGEIPDTERVELWISAENGQKLFTISDYHFYSFKHPSTDRYTLLSYWHCPLPTEVDAQMWFNFVLANYENVYPSSIPWDYLGFAPETKPLDAAFREYKPLVQRNLLGLWAVAGIAGGWRLGKALARFRRKAKPR